MTDQNVVHWVAVGINKDGKFIGMCNLKSLTSCGLHKDIHLSATLLSLKEYGVTSTPIRSKPNTFSAPSVSSWGIPEFHSYFRTKMKKFGGCLGLSPRDRENWKPLIEGYTKDILLSMIDAYVDRHEEACSSIPSLPKDNPSVGVLRGWSNSIVSWISGRTTPPTSVRESSAPRIKKGPFG